LIRILEACGILGLLAVFFSYLLAPAGASGRGGCDVGHSGCRMDVCRSACATGASTTRSSGSWEPHPAHRAESPIPWPLAS